MSRNPLAISTWVGSALAAGGVLCFVISSCGTELSDGYYVLAGPHLLKLPDAGLGGDGNTYFGVWGILGLSCLGAGTMSVLCARISDTVLRGLAIALLGLAIAAIISFSHFLALW